MSFFNHFSASDLYIKFGKNRKKVFMKKKITKKLKLLKKTGTKLKIHRESAQSLFSLKKLFSRSDLYIKLRKNWERCTITFFIKKNYFPEVTFT
jgi:hypothetical protein